MDDGKRLKRDSNFCPKKCCTSVVGEVDRISALPDDILVDILSLLSLREATATSVLSSRWSDLRKYTTNLEFNTFSIKSNDIDMLGLVNSTLHSHKALCLKQFSICFRVKRQSQGIVTKWLKFVLSRQVESLDLNFQCGDQRSMVFLKESLRESGAICPKPQTLIFFKSLKSLYLDSLIVIGEDIELFLHNCPLLKRLVIDSASLRSDVEITSLVLNELSIVNCIGRGLIKVSAPNLTSLGCDNNSGKLMLENNMPKLVEVDFLSRTEPKHYVQHFSSALSCCISQLKVLTLTIDHPKVFFANEFPEMPNLNKLVVIYYKPTELHLLRIADLIWASPHLQQFKLEFIEVFQKAFPHKEVVGNVNRSPHQHLKVFKFDRSPHQHLKVFKFEGFDGSIDYHMQLVMYIMNSCDALEKISLACYPVGRKGKTKRNCARQQFRDKVPNHIILQVV